MFHVKHSIQNSPITKEQLVGLNQLLSANDIKLSKYADLLLWWNSKINLVSRGVSRETVFEHVKHSLLLIDFVNKSKSKRVIDTGTGGGLPGIPLAICMPDTQFVLNDIVSKKMMAVKQMIKTLELTNVVVQSGSIERMEVNNQDLVITKHAFKLNELTTFLGEKDWSKLLFLKGEGEVANELSGINEPLKIHITNLDQVIKSEFYNGKAIVEVTRSHE